MTTRALILAAGQGTRLRPLTDNKPKTLVELMGKPLLERQLEVLKNAKITDIHVATGYQAQQIKDLGLACTDNPHYDSSNMVESMFCARSFIEQDGDLIISYGDIIYQPDNLAALLATEADIAIMVDKNWRQYWQERFDNPLEDAESLILNEQGCITQLGKKTDDYANIQAQYTGLFKISSKKIKPLIDFYDNLDRSKKYDGQDFDNMYMTSFLQLLIDNAWQAQAVLVNNGWLEVDSVADLELYKSLARQGKLDTYCKLN